ncbi:DUF4949 domain-containing protein [Legionella gresilensis]|uniref:DUF4949 domain-containing protein n=1 Tax=Legionella gresilensis TaxID=91823 RepID=UPI0010418F13|nr:DUF4949 domain-containing protein [Legionella gresilensis]
MKFSKLVLALPLLVSQSVFALTADKPDACPSIKALSAVGVSNAEFVEDGNLWVTYRPSNSFETADKWTLVVLPIEAKNASEAVSKANKSLPNLALFEGPSEEDGMWGCIYTNNDYSLMAIAVTPPLFGNWKALAHKFNVKITH